jgi:DNA-binding transcriptional ArsR family regulator
MPVFAAIADPTRRAILHRLSAGEMAAGDIMVTLYYLDGDHLMMTHFCMANNQPRMRADASSSPSAIKFKFVDATNLSSPEAGHMNAHSIIWKDAEHVTQH